MKNFLLFLLLTTVPLIAGVKTTNESNFQKRKSSYSSKRKSTSKKKTYSNRRSYSASSSKSCTYNGNSLNVGKRGGCYYYSGSGNKVYVDRAYCNNCN